MILHKEDFFDDDGSLGYTESKYDSNNLLTSIYFYKTNRLYLSFSRGDFFEFLNVSIDVFNGLQEAESNGKYFREKIFKNEKFPSRKMYKMYAQELLEVKNTINELKGDNNEN